MKPVLRSRRLRPVPILKLRNDWHLAKLAALVFPRGLAATTTCRSSAEPARWASTTNRMLLEAMGAFLDLVQAATPTDGRIAKPAASLGAMRGELLDRGSRGSRVVRAGRARADSS